jgi:hypothetical protein
MTVGLAREELEQLLAAAEADGPRSAALIKLLDYNGLRVDEEGRLQRARVRCSSDQSLGASPLRVP